MALFNKLFSTHKRKPVNASAASTKNAKQFPFTNEQVRILLYRECDWRGRRLLFDSTAVQKIPQPAAATRQPQPTMRRPSSAQIHSLNLPISLPPPPPQPSTAQSSAAAADAAKKPHPNYIDTVNGIAYRYAKPAEDDFNDIGEMVFGSVAMSVRATALKVHWLPEPMRFLCSQVFVTPVPSSSGQRRGGGGARDPTRSLQTLSNSTTTGHNGATTAAAAAALDGVGGGPSMDTSSLNSFSLSVSVCLSDGGGGGLAGHTHPLDVPQNGSSADMNGSNGGVVGGGGAVVAGTAPSERNLAYSDSGYSGTDPWTTSSSSSYYPFHTSASTRSSFGSVFSDRGDSSMAAGADGRKFSTDSSLALTSEMPAAAARRTASAADGGVIQRRIQRHEATSFENRKSQSDCVGYLGDQQHQQQQQQQQRGDTSINMTGTTTTAASHLSVGIGAVRAAAAINGGSEGCVATRVLANRRNSEQQQNAAETHSNPEFVRNRRSGVNGGIGGCGAAAIRSGKRAKLGLAVCIQLSDSVELEMQTFCAEHIVLLESMLCRLRSAAETAYANQKRFYQLMLHAWMATAEWLVDLFTAPRLVEPVWLALSGGYAQDAKHLAQGFMQELCWLLNCADTKDSNFFISTLLTAILTHHLGWVGTVAPLPAANGNAYDLTNSSNPNVLHEGQQLARDERAKMSEMARFHPYNVLWAQMSDLYGAIGSPPKVSKTIVCGTEEPLIGKVLNVLTYFIRCGQIEREIRAEVFEKEVIDDILDEFVSCTTKTASPVAPSNNGGSGGGLTRTSTCRTASLCDEDGAHLGRKNDIPNVLIFRDSRFVKQELRIGNFLMDTGIEMTGKQRHQIRDYRVKQPVPMDVKVLVTSPTLEEFSTVVGGGDAVSNGSDDTVEEATENESQYAGAAGTTSSSSPSSPIAAEAGLKTSPSLSDLITANSLGGIGGGNSGSVSGVAAEFVSAGASAFLWGIEPIKEGVIEEQWQHIRKGAELRRTQNASGVNAPPISLLSDEQSSTVTGTTVIELKRSKSLFSKSTNAKNVDRIRRSRSRKNIAQLADDVDGNHPPQSDAMIAMLDVDDDLEQIAAPPLKSYPSLSDLITANSCGASERLTWGIEPVKESVTLDEVHHFENSQKRIESNATLRQQMSHNSGGGGPIASPSPGVVFVLGGDNETLVNLKSSVSPKKSPAPATPSPTVPAITQRAAAIGGTSGKKTCSHKKHSGVKFNFEKYPQIATNYMKNKNIDLAHYDKASCMKLETCMASGAAGASTSMMATSTVVAAAIAADSDSDSDGSEECECCAGNATRTLLQTPSNATELEFSNEDNNYPTSTASIAVATTSRPADSLPSQAQQAIEQRATTVSTTTPTTRLSSPSVVTPGDFSTRTSSTASADPPSNSIRLITLPMSRYQLKTSTAAMRTPTAAAAAKNPKSAGKDDHREKMVKPWPAGFIPSLFVGITDHYVADMVLQGTTAPLNTWENRLKHNLSLSAHCATFESRITENVAILANTDKWDVKVVSSQTYVLPCGSGTSGPIGMSQLVATMLETVNAMWSAGLSAYQCMAYIESKLQELYLQSETLAAFLLATEFCSLSTVTAALNLSANDVPLLLSVASVHSPQVTKKYGVSFR